MAGPGLYRPGGGERGRGGRRRTAAPVVRPCRRRGSLRSLGSRGGPGGCGDRGGQRGPNPRRAAELRDRFVDTVGTVDRSAAKEQAPAAGEGAPGRVSIVGGGPGDPGLITVTGLRRLRE